MNSTQHTGESNRIAHILRLLSWPIAGVIVAAHVVWRDPAFTETAAACCGALGGVALIVLCHSPRGKLPIPAHVAFFFYAAMGYPAFYPVEVFGAGQRKLRVSSAGVEEAAMGVLLFALVGLSTVYLVRKLVGRSVAPLFARALDPAKYGPQDTLMVRLYALFGIAAAAVSAAYSGGSSLPFGSVTLAVSLLAAPAVVIGILVWDAAQTNTRTAHALVWTVTAIYMCLGLLTGMLGSAVLPLVLLVALLWALNRTPPMSVMIAVFVVLFGLNGAKHAYRSMTWRDGQYVALSQRAANWERSVEMAYHGRASNAYSESVETIASRFRSFAQVAQIFDWVPGRIPFAGVDKWLEIPLDFVPGFLYPEKVPHVTGWNTQYTLTFGLQNKEMASTTAVTLPAVGDGYWRLGWLGVVLEAIIFGSLFGYFAGMAQATSRFGLVFGLSIVGLSIDQHAFALLSCLPQLTIALTFGFGLLRLGGSLLRAGERVTTVAPATPNV